MTSRIVSMFLAQAAVAAAASIAIVNARIVPVSSPPIERGAIVIRDGKIVEVGARVIAPRDARKIEGAGLSVYPGWVNAYTSLGLTEIGSVRGSLDTTELGPFNPQAQAWVAVNPHNEMLRTARANGVTSALVAPAGGRIPGTASMMNLFGLSPTEMELAPRAGVVIEIATQPRASAGSTPTAAGSTSASVRRTQEDIAKLKDYLREAKAYAEMRGRGGSGVALDLPLENMIAIMRGERPAICHANTFRDIRTAVALGDEFGMKIIIAGGSDAWKVAGLLKEKNIPVIYDSVQKLPRSREDPYDVSFTTPQTLLRAGVRFAIATGGAADARNLPYHAAVASAYGLEREDALKAITLWPAEILGVADKVGSIEPGKLANLLVTRGDALDVRSEVIHVFIQGHEVPLESRNSELFEKFRR